MPVNPGQNASYAEVVTGRISPTPQGTSKLTGVREVFDSFHDTDRRAQGILASEHARVQVRLLQGLNNHVIDTCGQPALITGPRVCVYLCSVSVSTEKLGAR